MFDVYMVYYVDGWSREDQFVRCFVQRSDALKYIEGIKGASVNYYVRTVKAH